MEIGLISDTHGYLDPRIAKLFSNCDEIWHAGDFGSLEIAQQLSTIKPLRGVFGNIDDQSVRAEFPEDLRFECEGVDIWITHIAGRPGRYDRRVARQLQANAPQVLICGHSHILRVERDPKFAHMHYINPGAAGNQGSHQMRTVLKCRVQDGVLDRLRLIELGPRGSKHRQT